MPSEKKKKKETKKSSKKGGGSGDTEPERGEAGGSWDQHPATNMTTTTPLVAGNAFLDTIPEDVSVAAARIANLSTASAVASSVEEGNGSRGVAESVTSETPAVLGGGGASDGQQPSAHPEQPIPQSKPCCTKRKWVFYSVVVALVIAFAAGVYFVVFEDSLNGGSSHDDGDDDDDEGRNTNNQSGSTFPSPTIIAGAPTPADGTGATFPPIDFDVFVESEFPSAAPSLNPQARFEIDQILLDISNNNDATIYNPDTPQGTCRNWLISQDLIPSVVGDERIRQRYVLCVLYWSTTTPTDSSLWAIDWVAHECDWEGISCTNRLVAVITLTESNLVGTIPDELSALTSLQALSLFGNRLGGSIPSSLWLMPLLVWCDLSNNELTGNIVMPNAFAPSRIQILYLYMNQLQGSVPLERFPDLERVWIQDNLFTEIVWSRSIFLPQLTSLVVYDNLFSGRLSSLDWPSMFPALVDLDIAENLWSGELPESIWELANLRTLVAHDCQFSGRLAVQSSTTTTALEHVWLYGNQFTGNLPSAHGWNWRNLTSYLLFHNPALTGTISQSLCERWPNRERLETDCGTIDCACCTACGGPDQT